MQWKRRVGLALATGFFWLCFSCRAEDSGSPPRYSLHIEGQALDGALLEFARQTGIQVMIFSRLTVGHRSASLQGRYTTDAAMAMLLSGSNLTYRWINSKTIEILPR